MLKQGSDGQERVSSGFQYMTVQISRVRARVRVLIGVRVRLGVRKG